MTNKKIMVCALCGKKIDTGKIEIIPERSMIIRHMTTGEQLSFDVDMYGKDKHKYIKKSDVIKLIIRSSNNKTALIDSIKEL